MRHPDRQTRLASYLAEVRELPFLRLTTARWRARSKAMTGDDPARGWRGYRVCRRGSGNCVPPATRITVYGRRASLRKCRSSTRCPGDIAVMDRNRPGSGDRAGAVDHLVTPEEGCRPRDVRSGCSGP